MNENLTAQEILAAIQSDDEKVRTEGWLNAAQVGPQLFRDLAQIMASAELEVSRAAKRAMWKITRTVGAPGAKGRQQACQELYELLGDDQAVAVRREVLWMLSELGDATAVEAVATLLKHKQLREDSRMVLERLPGVEAVAALKAGFDDAPESFRYNLAQSLRKRGVQVDGYPCQKLVPTKQTRVKPVA